MKMRWRNYLVELASLATVVLFVVWFPIAVRSAVAHLRVRLSVIGVGKSSPSPDGKFLASQHSYESASLAGGSRQWAEFSISTAAGETLWSKTIEGADKQLACDLGSIVWSADSDNVVFEASHAFPDRDGLRLTADLAGRATFEWIGSDAIWKRSLER